VEGTSVERDLCGRGKNLGYPPPQTSSS